ncbi:hypothetical protein KP509_36G012500 [Ceratopteris richardii]|uniref:Uncharacterized protein n=1 Tax=Ceratopteris richardii TaxID=49495 RepID=A0A8T2Q9R3_CERRI|nr:hypothetical protein KP509_36G012500 [Ceratopteris richardii]
MGNSLACLTPSPASCCVAASHPPAPPSASEISSSSAVLVNAITGHVQELEAGTSVAEVMIEYPQSFLMLLPRPLQSHFLSAFAPATQRYTLFCSSSAARASSPSAARLVQVQVPCFFHALPADHKLEHGRSYLLLPMHKLNKRASPRELSLLCRLAELAVCVIPRYPSMSPSSISSWQWTSQSAIALPSAKTSDHDQETLSLLHDLFAVNPPLTSLTNAGESSVVHLPHDSPCIPRAKSWKPSLHTIIEGPPPFSFPPYPLLGYTSKRRGFLSTDTVRHQRRVYNLT